MDPDVLAEVTDAVHTTIGVVQAGAAWRRSRQAGKNEAEPDEPGAVVPGASTAVPGEAGPVAAHGRGEIVTALVRMAETRCLSRPQVLTAAGGMGKSTIARLVALKFGEADQRRVWWISASNEECLSGGLVSVARDLDVSRAEQEAIRSHRTLGEEHPDTLRTRQLGAFAAGYLAWARGLQAGKRAAAGNLAQLLDVQIRVCGKDYKETLETRALMEALARKRPTLLPWPQDLPRPAGL